MSEKVDAAWEPGGWQEHVNTILSIHYARHQQMYQEIPDRIQGDAGLEGYSTCGHGYQAYADQNSKDNEDRTRKQKKKLRTDLAKLVTYRPFWTSTLQDLKLSRWVMVVPAFDDKAVLKYGREQQSVIKGEKLPFLASDFQVAVCTDRSFPEARAIAVAGGLSTLPLPDEPPEDDRIDAFQSNRPDFVDSIDAKLGRLDPGMRAHERAQLRRDFLEWYLRGQNMLQHLREDTPVLWERIQRVKSARARTVATESRFVREAADQRLTETRKSFEAELRELRTGISHQSAETLSWSVIAEWLGECPLDFRGSHG